MKQPAAPQHSVASNRADALAPRTREHGALDLYDGAGKLLERIALTGDRALNDEWFDFNGDIIWGASASGVWVGPPTYDSWGYMFPSRRHLGNANLSFFDGHAESMPQAEAGREKYWYPTPKWW